MENNDNNNNKGIDINELNAKIAKRREASDNAKQEPIDRTADLTTLAMSIDKDALLLLKSLNVLMEAYIKYDRYNNNYTKIGIENGVINGVNEIVKDKKFYEQIGVSVITDIVAFLEGEQKSRQQTTTKNEYTLAQMTPQVKEHPEQVAEKGKIYLAEDGSYIVCDFAGNVTQGQNLTDLPNKTSDPDFTQQVLQIIAKRGHISTAETHFATAEVDSFLQKLRNFNETIHKIAELKLDDNQLADLAAKLQEYSIAKHLPLHRTAEYDEDISKYNKTINEEFHKTLTKYSLLNKLNTLCAEALEQAKHSGADPNLIMETRNQAMDMIREENDLAKLKAINTNELYSSNDPLASAKETMILRLNTICDDINARAASFGADFNINDKRKEIEVAISTAQDLASLQKIEIDKTKLEQFAVDKIKPALIKSLDTTLSSIKNGFSPEIQQNINLESVRNNFKTNIINPLKTITASLECNQKIDSLKENSLHTIKDAMILTLNSICDDINARAASFGADFNINDKRKEITLAINTAKDLASLQKIEIDKTKLEQFVVDKIKPALIKSLDTKLFSIKEKFPSEIQQYINLDNIAADFKRNKIETLTTLKKALDRNGTIDNLEQNEDVLKTIREAMLARLTTICNDINQQAQPLDININDQRENISKQIESTNNIEALRKFIIDKKALEDVAINKINDKLQAECEKKFSEARNKFDPNKQAEVLQALDDFKSAFISTNKINALDDVENAKNKLAGLDSVLLEKIKEAMLAKVTSICTEINKQAQPLDININDKRDSIITDIKSAKNIEALGKVIIDKKALEDVALQRIKEKLKQDLEVQLSSIKKKFDADIQAATTQSLDEFKQKFIDEKIQNIPDYNHAILRKKEIAELENKLAVFNIIKTAMKNKLDKLYDNNNTDIKNLGINLQDSEEYKKIQKALDNAKTISDLINITIKELSLRSIQDKVIEQMNQMQNVHPNNEHKFLIATIESRMQKEGNKIPTFQIHLKSGGVIDQINNANTPAEILSNVNQYLNTQIQTLTQADTGKKNKSTDKQYIQNDVLKELSHTKKTENIAEAKLKLLQITNIQVINHLDQIAQTIQHNKKEKKLGKKTDNKKLYQEILNGVQYLEILNVHNKSMNPDQNKHVRFHAYGAGALEKLLTDLRRKEQLSLGSWKKYAGRALTKLFNKGKEAEASYDIKKQIVDASEKDKTPEPKVSKDPKHGT